MKYNESVIILSGGLGNQMFQYALYLALKERGKNIRIDSSRYFFREIHNGYELKRCFGINDCPDNYSKLHLLYFRLLTRFKPKFLFFEDILQYDTQVFDLPKKYILGYWQTEKYFINIEDRVRDVFTFKNIDSKNQAIAEEMKSNTSVSIHIRRGDYLGNSAYENICTENYYTTAIDKMIEKIGQKEDVKFYIFSDDKEFAAKFAEKLNFSSKLIDFNSGSDSYKDMYLMSCCKHNIVANSSFSWWGAWLNTNQQKIVVAPKKWYNIAEEERYKDIVPEKWIKI